MREDVEKTAREADYPEWEFRDHWCSGKTAPKGWNDASIARTQTDKWKAFAALVQGNGPLGISHEAPVTDSGENLWAHNLLASYGYCVALASRSVDHLKILDWGGGVGHYYLFTRAFLPGVTLEYFCQEVPLLCEAGRALLPEALFLEEPDVCFAEKYDFVHAGSSLWYCEDWRGAAAKLADSTTGYLYITRMLFTNKADSFVAVQRPYKYGYETEYQCWVLNRREFLAHMETLHVQLVREFYFGEGPTIHNAPERGYFRGFLFRAMVVPTKLAASN